MTKINWLLAKLALVTAATAVPASPIFAEVTDDHLVKEWLSLEIQRGRLESAWEERKVILDQQARLLEEEAAALREVIDSHASSSSETDQERAEVLAEQTDLEEQQNLLSEKVELAAHRLSSSVKRLPPPLQGKWSQGLSKISDSNAPLSDRLDNLLRLLTELHEFNERVAIHTGNVVIPAEGANADRKVLVTQIYLGAARGWYVSSDGSHYGYGESRRDGWRWWHNSETVEPLGETLSPAQIQALVDIVQNPDKAALSGLPLAVGSAPAL